MKLSLLMLVVTLTACTSSSAPALSSPSPGASVAPVACQPTDQDQYVYHPDRLAVQADCVPVTGEVLAEIREADGDLHIRVQLDPAYAGMLTPANQQQCANDDSGTRVCGLLVVEPVCVRPVSQADAVEVCASDPDPLTNLPAVHQHVWLEGRYVLDKDHGGWAELHPLYRWG